MPTKNDIDFDFLDTSEINLDTSKKEKPTKPTLEEIKEHTVEVKDEEKMIPKTEEHNETAEEYIRKQVLIANIKNGSFAKLTKEKEEFINEPKPTPIVEEVQEQIKEVEQVKEKQEQIKQVEEKVEEIVETNHSDEKELDSLDDLLEIDEEQIINNQVEEKEEIIEEPQPSMDEEIPQNKEEQKDEVKEVIFNSNSKKEMEKSNGKVFGIDFWKMFSKKPKEEVKPVVSAEQTVAPQVEKPLIQVQPKVEKKSSSSSTLITGVVAFVLGAGAVYGAATFLPDVAAMIAQPAIDKAVEESKVSYESQITSLKAELEEAGDTEILQADLDKVKAESESFKQDILNEQEKVEKYKKYLIVLNNTTRENMESLFTEIEKGSVNDETKVVTPSVNATNAELKENLVGAINTDATTVTTKTDTTTVAEPIKATEPKKEVKVPNLSNLKKALHKEETTTTTTVAETKKVEAVAIPGRAEQIGEISAGEITTNNQ